MITNNNDSAMNPNESSTLTMNDSGHDNKGELEEDGDDMLTNLLGVESSTIDQMIEAKASAASLLGV